MSGAKSAFALIRRAQAQNARTALGALDQVRAQGLALSRMDIQKGFGQVEWPARFEILRENPPVVIDSAHNGDSMNCLRQSLDDYFPGQKFLLVFGASADKELDAMLTAILPRVERVITTQSTHPRAADPIHLMEIIPRTVCHGSAQPRRGCHGARAEPGRHGLRDHRGGQHLYRRSRPGYLA
jgi:dihydrofolate synthase/folylpolyglutamate synthase